MINICYNLTYWGKTQYWFFILNGGRKMLFDLPFFSSKFALWNIEEPSTIWWHRSNSLFPLLEIIPSAGSLYLFPLLQWRCFQYFPFPLWNETGLFPWKWMTSNDKFIHISFHFCFLLLVFYLLQIFGATFSIIASTLGA